MPNKMLIDASHPEETRVVVVRGNRIEEFDFESQDKKQLKGNIYLARVTRVEPSLQAAFVEYGGNRHGFLAFSEIHPDYYQIPMADRQALLRAEAEEVQSEDDEDESEERGRNRRRRRGGRNRGRATDEQKAAENDENGSEEASATEDAGAEDSGAETGEAGGDDSPRAMAEAVEADTVSEDVGSDERTGGGDDEDADTDTGNGGDDGEVESVGAEDALEEIRERRRPSRRQYKIQEVIKRRQILLVQVVKEERGNKGAALTTYLSLAGRYSVLMPNTARGGGISRKITNAQDRKRLKDVVKDLDVPQGMGVILRTAGESRTKAEIKRDYEYLMRLWDNVRTLTLQSSAPALVYEEGSLIKRSVRDLYNKDIDEILVSGEEGYREAKDFMRMLMPSHAKVVQPYRDTAPIFARNGIEAQLDKMLQPQVTLKSGGYIIINQTEALVAIDVNSGRSTKEHSIEDTALQTNLEAAEEVARQLRLRDLAGLIVIDFIDMEENRNNRAVEKRLKDHLKNDRARIQVGRISHFGLLEMSRQRIRASVLESTMQPCPHCGGAGHVRSESSVALHVVRAIEEFLLKDSRNHITVRTPTSTAIYVLNHKRSTLTELETRFGLTISVEADDSVRSQHYAIVKGAPAERPAGFTPPAPVVYPDEPEDDIVDEVVEEEETEAAAPAERRQDESGDGQRKRKRRRRRRGGRDRDREAQAPGETEGETADAAVTGEQADDDAAGSDDAAEQAVEVDADADGDGQPKKRRRGKRGGKRNRRDEATDETGSEDADTDADADALAAASEVSDTVAEAAPQTADQAAMDAVESAGPAVAEPEAEEAEKPKKKTTRRTSKKKAAEAEVAEAAADLGAPAVDQPVEAEKPAKPKAKRAPRRKAAAAEEAPGETVADAAQEEAPAQAAADEEPPAPKPEPKPSEPVVTSSTAPDEDNKPRKAGWWQRKSFF